MENVSDHKILHGEAVAIGMAYEAVIANRINIMTIEETEKIIRMIKSYDLNTKIPESIDRSKIYPAVLFDKKAIDGTVYMSLPEQIGRMHQIDKKFAVKIDREDIEKIVGN